MFKGLERLINSEGGKYIISIILGIGLSTLFRSACKERNCMVFRAVRPDKVENKIFKMGEQCYKYTTKSMECGKKEELSFD